MSGVIMTDGDNFTVGTLPGVGRVLFASRDIKAGELVLQDKAVVGGPANKTLPVCVECCAVWRGGGALCTKCGWPVCGPQCEAGPSHSVECSVLAKCPPSLRPRFADLAASEETRVFACIIPLRLALLARGEDGAAHSLALLMDHREDIEARPGFEEKWGEPVLRLLTETFDSGVSREELLRGIGIYITNAANMAPRTGRWLLPTFSFLSHSCVSNSRFFISPGGVARVRAQVDIRAGEEVTISYLPPMKGNITRRRTIRDLWHFECACPRCLDVTELGTCLAGVTCAACQETMLPRDAADISAPYACPGCGKEVNSDTVAVMARAVEEQIKVLRDPGEIETLIDKLGTNHHPNNYLIMELKQKFVDLTMGNNGSSKTKETLEKVVDFIRDIIKVNNKIEPGLTVTLGTNLRLLNTAMLSLAKMKMEAGDIDKKEFMMTAMVAKQNISLAKRCLEDTDFENWK